MSTSCAMYSGIGALSVATCGFFFQLLVFRYIQVCLTVTHIITKPMSGCVDQKAAARKFGYNQKLWDSRTVPEQAKKYTSWNVLTAPLQKAAKDLGWTQKSWDAGKPVPATMSKKWAELNTCGEDPPSTPPFPHHNPSPPSPLIGQQCARHRASFWRVTHAQTHASTHLFAVVFLLFFMSEDPWICSMSA